MTRPAVNFNGTIYGTANYKVLFPDGRVFSNKTIDVSIMGRYGHKVASVSTPTKTRKKRRSNTTPLVTGVHHQPTTYSAAFWSLNSSDRYAELRLIDGKTAYFSGGTLDKQTLTNDPLYVYAARSATWAELEIKALNKLRNAAVNFGVALAESKEAAEMFHTAVSRIAKGVRSFRKRYPRDFAQAAANSGTARWKKVPSGWLELQYGWRPLMSDVVSACSAADDSVRTEGGIFLVHSSKRIKERAITGELVSCAGLVNLTLGSDVTSDCSVRLWYKLNNWYVAELSSLGLTNPFEIVWERIPYSFVVDWFLPVGNWLSALGGDFGYTFQYGCRSEFNVGILSVETRRKSGTVLTGHEALGVSGRWVGFKRSLYPSSPVPGLYLKSPVSSGHIANAMSLLVQAFRRG